MCTKTSFSKAFGTDSTSFVINETAAAMMGMDDPVGQSLTLWSVDGEIVGVMILAGFGAMIIAWLTVGYQSIKVAAANPVVALRSE